MPYDSEVTKLQGEISQLEEEINLLESFKNTITGILANILLRTINRLQSDLEYKEMKLSIHRQKTRESGVKY